MNNKTISLKNTHDEIVRNFVDYLIKHAMYAGGKVGNIQVQTKETLEKNYKEYISNPRATVYLEVKQGGE